MKFSTTFVQNTFLDSKVRLDKNRLNSKVRLGKNRPQSKLFQNSDSTNTSTCNSYISQTVTDMKVILVAYERQRSLLSSIKC
jgi:hypothetical protein